MEILGKSFCPGIPLHLERQHSLHCDVPMWSGMKGEHWDPLHVRSLWVVGGCWRPHWWCLHAASAALHPGEEGLWKWTHTALLTMGVGFHRAGAQLAVSNSNGVE